MPFERNWQHLAVDPFFFFLEVGANNHELERDFLEPMLQDRSGFGNAGGFLISFEPLLDKYGFLLAYGAPSMHFANLGLQHRRTLVLPYAVSTCDGPTATFHVAPIDGCSSLRAPASDFKRKNMDETRPVRAMLSKEQEQLHLVLQLSLSLMSHGPLGKFSNSRRCTKDPRWTCRNVACLTTCSSRWTESPKVFQLQSQTPQTNMLHQRPAKERQVPQRSQTKIK